MKILFLAFILRGPFFAPSPDSLPNRDSLFASLRAFHVESAAAKLVEFDVVDRAAWTHLLPSVGITLGQPTVSFSLGQWLNFREQKAIRKAKKAFILRGPILDFKVDSFSLVALLRQYDNLTTGFNYLMKVEAVENQKFELIKEKWRDGTLAPLDWLNAQSANLASGEPLRARREALEQLEIEIRKLAKF